MVSSCFVASTAAATMFLFLFVFVVTEQSSASAPSVISSSSFRSTNHLNIPLGQSHSFPIANAYLTQTQVTDLWYDFFWNTYFINMTTAITGAWDRFDKSWNVALFHACPASETAGSQVFEFTAESQRPVLGELTILNETFNITVLPGGILQITGLIDWKATTDTTAFGVQGNCPVGSGDCSCSTGAVDFLCCSSPDEPHRNCLGGVEVSIHVIYNASLLLLLNPTKTGYVDILPTSNATVVYNKIVYPCESILDPQSLQTWLFASNASFFNNLTTSLLRGQEWIRESIQQRQLAFTDVTLRTSMARQITQHYQTPSGMWISYFVTHFWSEYENFLTVFVNGSFSFVSSTAGWQEFFNASLCDATQEDPPSDWPVDVKAGLRISSAALQAMVWAAYIDGTFHMFNHHKVVDANVLLRMFVTEPVTSVPRDEVLHMYVAGGSSVASCVSEIDHRNKTLVEASFSDVGVHGSIALRTMLPLTIFGKVHNFEFQRSTFTIEKPTGGFPRQTLQRIIEKGLNESIPFVNWGLKRNGFSMPSVTQYLMTPSEAQLALIHRAGITCSVGIDGPQGYFQLAKLFAGSGTAAPRTPVPAPPSYPPNVHLFKLRVSLFKRDPNHNSTVRRGTACDPTVTGNQMTSIALMVDEKYFYSAATSGRAANSPCEHMLTTSSADYYFQINEVNMRQMDGGNNDPGAEQADNGIYRYFPSSVRLLCTSGGCEPSSCIYVGPVPKPDECVWLDPFHNISNMSQVLNFETRNVEFDALAMGVVPKDASDGDPSNVDPTSANPYRLPDMTCSPATVLSSGAYRQPQDVSERVMLVDPSCGLADTAYWSASVAVRGASSPPPSEGFAVNWFNAPHGQETNRPLSIGVDNDQNLYYCRSSIPTTATMMKLVCVEPPLHLPTETGDGSGRTSSCVVVPGENHFPNASLSSYFIAPQQMRICKSDYTSPHSSRRWNSNIVTPDENVVTWPVILGGLLIMVVLGVGFAFLRTYLSKVRQQRLIEELKRRMRKRRQQQQLQQQKNRPGQNQTKSQDEKQQTVAASSSTTSARRFGTATRSKQFFQNPARFPPEENGNNNDDDDEDSSLVTDSDTAIASHHLQDGTRETSRDRRRHRHGHGHSQENYFDDGDDDDHLYSYDTTAYNDKNNGRRLHFLRNRPGEIWTQAEKIHSLSCLVAALSFMLLGLTWEDPFQRISMDSARGLGIPDVVDISPMADYFKWWSFALLRSSVLICSAGLLVLGVLPFAGPLSVDFHEAEEEEDEAEEDDGRHHEEKHEREGGGGGGRTVADKASDKNEGDEDQEVEDGFDEVTEQEIIKIRRSYPAFGDESFWRHCRSHAMFASITIILLALIVPLFAAPIRNGTFVEQLGSKNSLIGGKTTHDEIMLLSSLATTLVAAPIVLNLICMFLTAIPVGTLLGLILHDYLYGESEAITPAAAVATITTIVEKPRPINNVVAHSVFVQLIISILLPLVVLIFVFCMFQSTQSSETWLHTWGIYCLLVVSTSAILLMRVLFRYGPATTVLVLLCITDFALIARINNLSQPFLGDVGSTTFSLFHICLVVVDAIGVMEAPHEGSKKARWYHKIADWMFRNIVYPVIWAWYLLTRAAKNVCCCCCSSKRRSGVPNAGGDNDEKSFSQKMSDWVEQKRIDLLAWEDEYFQKLAAKERQKRRKNGEAVSENDDESEGDDDRNCFPQNLEVRPSSVPEISGNETTEYGSTSQRNPSAPAAVASQFNGNDDDDDEQQMLQDEQKQQQTSHLLDKKSHIIVREQPRLSKNRQHHALSHVSVSSAAASAQSTSSAVVHFSAATAFYRFCRDYLFMEQTGATADTAPIFGFRPWWRRLAGLICLGCFAYIVAIDSASVHETVRNQLIHALNSTMDFPSNISKIHLSVDPGLATYQTAIDQQFTYTWVTLLFIALGVATDWFVPSTSGLYVSKVFFGCGFVVMLTSLLIIATPNYVKECGLANAVPYCAPKFYRDGVWILSTTSGLFFALLVLSQLAPVLIALAPTMARLLWLVASLTRIFDSRWLLVQIAIFTPVTVFLPLLAAAQVTNFAPVVTVAYLLLFLPVAIAGVAYGLRIRSVAFVSVSLIWVATFIGLWIDLGVRLEQWNPWFVQYLVELLSHAKFYCELFAELCLTAICTSDIILHLLRNQVSGDTHSIPPRQQQFLAFTPVLNQVLNLERDLVLGRNEDEDKQKEESLAATSFYDLERCEMMHRYLLPPAERSSSKKRIAKAKMMTMMNMASSSQDQQQQQQQQQQNQQQQHVDDDDGRRIGFWNAAAILTPQYISHKRALMLLRQTNTSELALHVSPFVVDCFVDSIRGAIFAGVLRDGLLGEEIFGKGGSGGTARSNERSSGNDNEQDVLNNVTNVNGGAIVDDSLLNQVQDRVLVLDATNWKFFSEHSDAINWNQFHQKSGGTTKKWEVVIGVVVYAKHHFVAFKYEVRSHKLIVCESNHEFLAINSASFMCSLSKLIGTEAAPGGFLKKILVPPQGEMSDTAAAGFADDSRTLASSLAPWTAPPPTFFLSVPQHPIEESAYGCVNDMLLLSGRQRGNISQTKVQLLCETLLEEQQSEVDPLSDDTWAKNACRLI